LTYTFFTNYVAMQCSSRVMLHCNIPQGLCWIVTFFNGYVTLWHPSWLTYVELVHSLMLLWHYNVQWGLRFITIFLEGDVGSSDICLGLCLIVTLILVDLCQIYMCLNGYLALSRSSRVMLHFVIHQWLFWLWRSSKVMYNSYN
jgi:hypothetical protein